MIAVYKRRPQIEEQNRDAKTGYGIKKLHLRSADRLERMWVLMGLAFYISYCNEAVHDEPFSQRMSRRYHEKDGRKDLSWLSLAKYAELNGLVNVVLQPLAAQ